MENLIKRFIKELKEWRQMDNKTDSSAINLVSIVSDFLDDLENEEELENENQISN